MADERRKRTDIEWYDPEDLFVEVDKGHPLYDPERISAPLNEITLENYELRGITVPIIAKKDTDSTKILVVDGRRRTLGLRVANKRRVAKGQEPWLIGVIFKRSSAKDLFSQMVLLNAHREDRSITDNIRLAQFAIDELHMEPAEAACDMKVPESTLKKWLLIGQSHSKVQTALAKGLLDETAAARVAKSPPEQQAVDLAEAIKAAEGLEGKQARRAVSRAAEGKARASQGLPVVHRPTMKQKRALLASGVRGASGMEVLAWVLDGTKCEEIEKALAGAEKSEAEDAAA